MSDDWTCPYCGAEAEPILCPACGHECGCEDCGGDAECPACGEETAP